MNLRQCRIANKEKQSDVANVLGIDRSTYTKYETGASEPSFEILIMLAEHWGASVDYLLGVEKKAPQSDDLTEEQQEFIQFAMALTVEQRKMIRDIARTVLGK